MDIFTDDPDHRDLRVPVTIVKRACQRITAMPNEVTLTAPPGQPIASRIVLIRDTKDKAVVVERVVADDAAIVCTWGTGTEQPGHRQGSGGAQARINQQATERPARPPQQARSVRAVCSRHRVAGRRALIDLEPE